MIVSVYMYASRRGRTVTSTQSGGFLGGDEQVTYINRGHPNEMFLEIVIEAWDDVLDD